MARERRAAAADKPLEVEAILAAVARILEPPADGAGADGPAARLGDLVRHMAADGHGRADPMREVFARLGDKWSMLLLLLLRAGSFRHSVLRRLASVIGADRQISQRMLTLRLRSLERDGLVTRTITPAVPPRVDYRLSPLGESLLGQIDGLMGWVRAHAAEIRAARQRFAAGRDEG